MKLLVKNIATLAGVDRQGLLRRQGRQMSELNVINDAYLLVEDGVIADFGSETDLVMPEGEVTVIDAERGTVLPCWCDSHTHIV